MTNNKLEATKYQAGEFIGMGDPSEDEVIENFSHQGSTDDLPAMSRMLAESNDWYVEFSEDGRVVKAVRRRDEEDVKWVDPEEADLTEEEEKETDSDDLMVEAELGYEEEPVQVEATTPTAPWDLVFWTEARQTTDGDIIKVEMDAPAWPHQRGGRLIRGYASNLERAVRQGIKPSTLVKAIGDALDKGLVTKVQSKRLWEIQKIENFVRRKGVTRLETRPQETQGLLGRYTD